MTLKYIVIRLFSFLTHLYPASFREEFADELRGVFADMVNEPIRPRRFWSVYCLARECFVLPGNLFLAFADPTGGHFMNTTQRNMAKIILSFLLGFLIIIGFFMFLVDKISSINPQTVLLALSLLFVWGILFIFPIGWALASVLSQEKTKRIMLASGVGGILGPLLFNSYFWILFGIPLDRIPDSWDPFFMYAWIPLWGLVLGLFVGWAWKGWKTGILFAIASSLIFGAGYASVYFSLSLLLRIGFYDQVYPGAFGESVHSVISWIVCWGLFGLVTGLFWWILADRAKKWGAVPVTNT